MAFIFDIDGTLIDSNDYHARAWEQAFAKFGIAVSWQEIRPHIGKGRDAGIISSEKTEAFRISLTHFALFFAYCAKFKEGSRQIWGILNWQAFRWIPV